MMDIPFTTERRPDSGMTNPVLGMWLFLASEVMLFGSLFSAYALLRLGAAHWPSGSERLHPSLGALNTALLISSSAMLVVAQRFLRAPMARRPRARLALLAAVVLGVAFIAIKLGEYQSVVTAGFVPSSDIFTAMYFTLSGVHLLHLLGGLAVGLFLAGPGFRDHLDRPALFAQRVDLLSLYWHFVDIVWIVLFVLLYLT